MLQGLQGLLPGLDIEFYKDHIDLVARSGRFGQEGVRPSVASYGIA